MGRVSRKEQFDRRWNSGPILFLQKNDYYSSITNVSSSSSEDTIENFNKEVNKQSRNVLHLNANNNFS